VDLEEPTAFSFSGYKGSKPMIGRMLGYEFYLHRRNWPSTFAPAFYAKLVPQDRGAIIEGYFDFQPWVKMFMKLWQGVLVVVGGLLFFLSLLQLLTGGKWVEGNPVIGLFVAPVMFAFGIWLPKYGWWVGRHDEHHILEFLKSTLDARTEQPEQNTSGRVGR
jgi:hypothetical protein